jgi:hypothetical protein
MIIVLIKLYIIDQITLSNHSRILYESSFPAKTKNETNQTKDWALVYFYMERTLWRLGFVRGWGPYILALACVGFAHGAIKLVARGTYRPFSYSLFFLLFSCCYNSYDLVVYKYTATGHNPPRTWTKLCPITRLKLIQASSTYYMYI